MDLLLAPAILTRLRPLMRPPAQSTQAHFVIMAGSKVIVAGHSLWPRGGCAEVTTPPYSGLGIHRADIGAAKNRSPNEKTCFPS